MVRAFFIKMGVSADTQFSDTFKKLLSDSSLEYSEGSKEKQGRILEKLQDALRDELKRIKK